MLLHVRSIRIWCTFFSFHGKVPYIISSKPQESCKCSIEGSVLWNTGIVSDWNKKQKLLIYCTFWFEMKQEVNCPCLIGSTSVSSLWFKIKPESETLSFLDQLYFMIRNESSTCLVFEFTNCKLWKQEKKLFIMAIFFILCF